MNAKKQLPWPRLRGATQFPQFVYEPIPQGEYIRVLELSPKQGQITGQMRVISLEQAFRSYDAVSYCWGGQKNTVGILVNQKTIAITINLHDALLRLRHESGSQSSLVWADAICINQKDKKEQSSQVQMMGKIYEYARCVPVWLGVDDGNIAKDSFDLMKETARACRELLDKYGGPTQIPQPMPENPFCQDVEKWGKLDALVSLPWFKRVWVKQEVGLAAQSVLMLGNESLDLKDMIEIPLLGFVRGDLFPPNHTTLEGMRDTSIEIWRSYGNSISWRNELSGNILRSIVEKEQEGSFLKVFTWDARSRQLILETIYYTKSIFDVYYDTACAVLKAYPSNLTFLLSCVDRDRKALEENFPTWVPQWHRARPVSAFGYPSESMDDPDVQFTLLEDKSLKLSGLVFDEISWISSPMTRSDFDPTTAPLKIIVAARLKRSRTAGSSLCVLCRKLWDCFCI